jgi:hypothetical protein
VLEASRSFVLLFCECILFVFFLVTLLYNITGRPLGVREC